MKPEDFDGWPPEQVDAAVSRLLAAEQAADTAIAESKRRAAALVEEARIRARTIHSRAEVRISRTHVRCLEDTGHRVAQLQAAEREIARRPTLDTSRAGHLEEAVQALADALIEPTA